MTTLPGVGSFRDTIPAVEALGGGTQGGAQIPTGPDGDAGGSGRGRARRGRIGGRQGDGRGDADRRQTANQAFMQRPVQPSRGWVKHTVDGCLFVWTG